MNPLEDCPQLFANGEFYIKSKETSEPDEIFILSGYAQVISGKGWTDEVYFTKEGYNAVVESCQLIARPISDMTDEEEEKWKSFYHENYMNRMIPCYSKQTAYLLSIGVYPFDQSHFGKGKLIDINEIDFI